MDLEIEDAVTTEETKPAKVLLFPNNRFPLHDLPKSKGFHKDLNICKRWKTTGAALPKYAGKKNKITCKKTPPM
jgi:hypothetical protein